MVDRPREIKIVILSEVEGSRSEPSTQSKDPYPMYGARGMSRSFYPRRLESDFANPNKSP
jgi:hypothetical protein